MRKRYTPTSDEVRRERMRIAGRDRGEIPDYTQAYRQLQKKKLLDDVRNAHSRLDTDRNPHKGMLMLADVLVALIELHFGGDTP